MFILTAIMTFSSCETFDLDQLDNPSQLPKELLDPIYVFNYVQLTLPDFVNSANSFTQRVTRQMAMTGGNSYDNAFAPVNSDNNWTTGYLMLNAIKTMEPKAKANNQYFILGASKIMRAYVLMTMVDIYGDIPYTEALQGNANLTPKYDKSAAVYAGVYEELNQAIADLNNTLGNDSPRDLYYGNDKGVGDKIKWITLAKTLKLKMLNNSRLVGTIGTHNVVSEITALLADNDLIDTPDEDFAFKYGTNRVNPNSRHPLYNDHYELGAGAYISNYFMWSVSFEKGFELGTSGKPLITDPREAYYFFKQASLKPIYQGDAQAQLLPCKSAGSRPDFFDDLEYRSFYTTTVKAPFCVAGITADYSYLGRDHGDNSGIPADSDYRTVAGIYPAGGEIGAATNVNSNTNAGIKGELGRGIMPMLLSSYVYFIKAEINLTLGISSAGQTARQEFENGIKASVEKTTTFIPMPIDATSPADLATQKSAYYSFVLSKFDTSNAAKKLELIVKEYYIASWGNGIEPYNNYRRTGYPSNFQPTIEENPGNFFSTALYPGASVNNNPNAPANVRTKKVFWDVAALNLH